MLIVWKVVVPWGGCLICAIEEAICFILIELFLGLNGMLAGYVLMVKQS